MKLPTLSKNLKRPEKLTLKPGQLSLSFSHEFTLREKILFGVLAVLLVAIFYLYAVHFPVVNGIQDAESIIQSTNDEIIILEAQKANMDALQAELDNTNTENHVEIPPYDNLDLLMNFLNTVLSATVEYSLSFPGVDQPEEGGSIARRYLELSMVCPSYAAARSTIDKLQNCPYRCLVNETSISPYRPADADTATLSSGQVQVSLSMVFYESIS